MRVSAELGLERIDDLERVELEEIGQLEWLKPVQKAKLLKLCRLMSADSETSV